MSEEMAKWKTGQDTKIKDTPLTLATIQAFRDMLDVMEQFIRDTERERLENEQ
jgi:hypothetical protein